MIHKRCGSEIEEWKTENGHYYHPFFVGYCPECDVGVTKKDVKNTMREKILKAIHRTGE